MTAPSPRGPWPVPVVRADTGEHTPIILQLPASGDAQMIAGPCRFVLDDKSLDALELAVQQIKAARAADHETRRREAIHRRRQLGQEWRYRR